MGLRKWDDLPEFMKTEEVKPYYEVLMKKRFSLFFKRTVDLVGGIVLLVLLAIPMAIISALIKLDSPVLCSIDRNVLPLMGGSLEYINSAPW